MRVPTLFRARSNAAAPIGDITGPPRGEAGIDTESWLEDFLGGGPDINPELTGSAKFHVFDEMASTDSSVKSTIMFLQLPVRSGLWGLNAATDDPEAQLIRDAVNWQFGVENELGQLDLSWDELMQQGLGQIMRMGPCIEELVWDDAKIWYDADGDSHLLRPLARMALRPAYSIRKVKRAKGRIVTVEQEAANARPIPGDKVSYMVFERKGNRWDGESMLRPMWGAWTLKKALMVSAGMGWDRFAFGTPTIWHPDDPGSEEKAIEIVRNLQAHERGYIHFPVPADATSRADSLWDLEIKSGAQSIADPVPLLRYFTELIYEAGMEQFARQGFGQTGARASAQTQADPYYLAIQALAHYYRRERLRQMIRPFVTVNFGQEAADRWTPLLTVSKIEARNIDVISRAIALLAPIGFTLTTPEDQDDLRALLGFGELKEAADQMGMTQDELVADLEKFGLDAATIATVVNALPPDVGVKRNVPANEGAGLIRANAYRHRARELADERVDDLQRRIEMAEREGVKLPNFEITSPPVDVKVEQGDTHLHLPEGLVKLEVEQGDTTVEPAAVTVNVPAQRRATRARTRKEGGQTVIDYEYESDDG